MGFGKSDWVAMFREIGLDEPTMQRWHVVFEQRSPDAHQSFLEWLGEPAEDVDRIRNASRNDWTG
jgi:hypothetical protein